MAPTDDTGTITSPSLTPAVPSDVENLSVIGFDLSDESGCDRQLVDDWTWFLTPEGIRLFVSHGQFETGMARSAPCAYRGSIMRLYPNHSDPHFHSIAIHPPLDWDPDVDFEIWFEATNYRAYATWSVSIPGQGWTVVLLPFGPESREVTISSAEEAYFDDLAIVTGEDGG